MQRKSQELLKLPTACVKLGGGLPSAKQLYPSQASLVRLPLTSQRSLPSLLKRLAAISASPHLLFLPKGILSNILSLHLMLFPSAKTLFSKTNVYGCSRNIGKYANQIIKEAAEMTDKQLHKAQWSHHGEGAVCIFPKGHGEHTVPKQLWKGWLLPCVKPHSAPCITLRVNPTLFHFAKNWYTTKADICRRCIPGLQVTKGHCISTF